MNKRLILYVHGQGGCAEEASVYEPLFPDCAVKGMVYTATSPWEAREEFPAVFDCMCSDSERITLIANSIGAYFSMEALPQSKLEKAYFISPIVHMEKLIETMMGWANVTEKELQKRRSGLHSPALLSGFPGTSRLPAESEYRRSSFQHGT